jgi:hypothetical protein
MMSLKGGWRDLLVSLSIANLWFTKLWLKILPYNRGSNFFLPYSPLNTYLAALLNVATGGGLIFLLLRFCRRRPGFFPWLVLALFFCTGIIVVYGVGAAFISFARFLFLFGPHSAAVVSVCCFAGGILGILLLVRYRRELAQRYAVLPLLFAPFLLVTVSQSLLAIARVEPSARFLPHVVTPAQPLANPLHKNVVWVIFDETDYRLGFGTRPASLSLPAFDSFRKGALFATSAYSPNDNTQTSLPSLLTGVPLERTEPLSASRLDLIHAGTLGHSDFTREDTIFKEVKKRGGSTALFGWFLPYSRVMQGVDLGHHYARYNVCTSDKLLEVYLCQWREIVDMRFLPRTNTLLANNQIRMVRQMRSDIDSAIRGNDASFMFLHYSVPHSPNIYDRRTGRFGFNRNKREGYLDNLALADRCFAQLRQALEEKGIWDSSLVIVSSDHHWRTNTYDGILDKQHVPFMVKFPHQQQGTIYQGKFNTILTKDLILQVLDGKVNSPQEAGAWLDLEMLKGKTPIVVSVEQPDAD